MMPDLHPFTYRDRFHPGPMFVRSHRLQLRRYTLCGHYVGILDAGPLDELIAHGKSRGPACLTTFYHGQLMIRE
jgi:hypothetical protein